MPADLKRIMIAPDSFKGSLSASQAAAAMRLGILRVLPQADIVCYPMADGGEGTLDSILAALGGERRQLEVSAASGGKMVAEYGVLQQAGKSVAIIEAAQVVGLTLPQTASVSVMQRSSVGLGELLRHALDAGIRHFMIGLGGSGTNDGGAGLLQGLGLQLLDCEGQSLLPTPEGLMPLAVIDSANLDPRLADSQIQILSDVDNILCGPQGATYVFGPQKGVQSGQLHALDASLKRYASLLEQQNRPCLSLQAGTGAAGGLGFALQWLGGAYRSGAETLLQLYDFDRALQNADWVITGEGRSDRQTLHGKAPWVVAQHAARAGVPTVLVSGAITEDARAQLESQFMACYMLTNATITPDMAMRDAAKLLAERTAQAISGCLTP